MKNLESFKDIDIYSLSMFTLYKLTDIPEYSILGELPYILGRKELFDLCTYFGGRTIRIPTVTELNSMMYLLLLYQYTKIDNVPYDEAVKMVGYKSNELRGVKRGYLKLCKVLENYKFERNIKK